MMVPCRAPCSPLFLTLGFDPTTHTVANFRPRQSAPGQRHEPPVGPTQQQHGVTHPPRQHSTGARSFAAPPATSIAGPHPFSLPVGAPRYSSTFFPRNKEKGPSATGRDARKATPPTDRSARVTRVDVPLGRLISRSAALLPTEGDQSCRRTAGPTKRYDDRRLWVVECVRA